MPESLSGGVQGGVHVRTRPRNLLYDVEEQPPTRRLLLLGLQYMVLDAIYLVLVAIILRHAHAASSARVNAMGIACIAAAVGIALQALPRGPVGSGYLAPPVFSATYLGPSVLAAELGGIPLVCGMTLFAGLVEVLVGLALNRLRIVITPVLSGLTVFVVGLQLGIVGIGETLDVAHEKLPAYPLHLAVAFGTLAIAVTLSIWGRGIVKMLGTMLGLAAGMAGASAIGLIEPDRLAGIEHAGWLALPHPIGGLTFSLALTPPFAAAGIAAALRTAGVLTTCQRLNDAGWRRPDMDNIRKGVLADGLATLISGALGAPGMSTAPSLVGISSATGVTSRAIAFAASAVFFLVAFSPKIAGLFLLVPHEVAGALLVFTSSFMIAGGMEIMLSRKSNTRTVYIIGISTLLALSHAIFPAYYQALPEAMKSFSGSSLALGLTAAIALTLLFRIGADERTTIPWRAGDAAEDMRALDAAIAALRAEAEGWKVPIEVREVALGHVANLLRYLARAHAQTLSGTLGVRYDGQELSVDIVYPGAHMAPLPGPHPPASLDILDNEEAAAVVGLRNFLHGLMADHKQLRLSRNRVRVELRYNI
ncbi:MAG TPA: solute carrier family 23 protein [Acetobacteraceae bacterium]|nr:solute carrier family 23 protein [Acetobacteraceae bacterium]